MSWKVEHPRLKALPDEPVLLTIQNCELTTILTAPPKWEVTLAFKRSGRFWWSQNLRV